MSQHPPIVATLMSWVTLCTLDELTDGRGKSVDIDGYRLAVFLDRGQVSAIDGECPHAGADLANGHVEDGCAICPWHQWAFELSSGQLRGSPGVAVRHYPVRLHDAAGRRFVQADLPQV